MSARRLMWGSLALGGVLVLSVSTFCCGEHAPVAEPATPAPAAGAEAEAPASVSTPAAPQVADAGPPSNPVAHSMAQHDANDRELLADIERITKKPPSADVLELVSLRKQGKTREELEQFIAEHVTTELAVRVQLERWLDAVVGPRQAPADPTAPLGRGGNPRQVQPLKPRNSPTP